jgi:signal transduction histidine kinase
MKLTSKLSIVLIITVLTAGILISIFSLQATKSFFAQYILKVREVQLDHWEKIFTDHYLYQGSWQGVESIKFMGGQMMHRSGMGWGMYRQSVVLTDVDGKILNHPDQRQVGLVLEKSFLNQGRPIKLDERVIGYIFPMELFIADTKSLEQKFITSVLYAVILGTLLASLVAIFFGLWWSRRLTRPLEALAIASNKVAKGNFNHRISLTTKDELGSLAKAFNTMAQELDRSHKVRKQMFADISHELRTPLTILGSRLEAALENEESLNAAKISSLYDEVIRLQGLVKELQDISNLEAGQVNLNIQKINLQQLTEDLRILLEAEAEAREIIFNIDIHQDLNYFYADPLKLKQVILNLLSNAFHYTQGGGKVFLRMYLEEQDIVIEVADTGPGIAKEELPHIFERFYRADKSRNRATGGVGLGLAIAKGYVEAHGGTIDVESEVGKGTKFIIKLPKK